MLIGKKPQQINVGEEINTCWFTADSEKTTNFMLQKVLLLLLYYSVHTSTYVS